DHHRGHGGHDRGTDAVDLHADVRNGRQGALIRGSCMNRIRKSRRGRRNRSGFSLIEVVMVTVIVGILASLTVPTFHLALEQSRANVAGANLRAIWSAQRLYWLENRTYAPDLATLYSLDLLDSSVSSQSFYTYEIASYDAASFSALATRTLNGGWN